MGTMYWNALIVAAVLGTAAVIAVTYMQWRMIYIGICMIGCVGMPLGFSACIYDASIQDETSKALFLIFLFALIVVIALICGRRLFPSAQYRLIFLFGCLYFIFVSSGLFGHYYLETQRDFFLAAYDEIYDHMKYQSLKWFYKIHLYWCYIRAGFPLFFEIPPYEQLTVVNITQFLIGKMIEICAIGTIAEGMARMITPVERRNKRDK